MFKQDDLKKKYTERYIAVITNRGSCSFCIFEKEKYCKF